MSHKSQFISKKSGTLETSSITFCIRWIAATVAFVVSSVKVYSKPINILNMFDSALIPTWKYRYISTTFNKIKLQWIIIFCGCHVGFDITQELTLWTFDQLIKFMKVPDFSTASQAYCLWQRITFNDLKLSSKMAMYYYWFKTSLMKLPHTENVAQSFVRDFFDDLSTNNGTLNRMWNTVDTVSYPFGWTVLVYCWSTFLRRFLVLFTPQIRR